MNAEGIFHCFQNISFGFVLYEVLMDDHGHPFDFRFREVNPAFSRITGIKADACIGHTLNGLNLDPGREWTVQFSQIATTGQPVTFELYSKPVSKWFKVSAFISEPGMLAAVFDDITDHFDLVDKTAESEKKYKQLFEKSNDGLIIHDYQGIILEVNEKICEILKTNPGKLVGKPMSDLRHDRNRELFQKNLSHILSEGINRIETQWQQADGKPVDLEIIGRIWNENEELILASIRDITSRKNLERNRLENENRMAAIFLQSAVGVAQLDLDGHFIQTNQRFSEICGYSQEELRQMSFHDITHDDDRHAGFMLREKLTRKEILSFTSEKKYIHKQGHTVWVNRSISAIYNENGEALFFIAIVEDISEKHKAFELLKASEETLRRVMEDQEEFLIRWKPDGTLTFANRAYCEYYQINAAEALTHNLFDTLHPKEKPRLREKIARLSIQNPSLTDKHPTRLKNGSLVWHQWADRGIFDGFGNLIEVQSIGHDITQLVEAEEKLRIQNLFFEYLFENSPFGIVFVDMNDRILDINPAFIAMFGYSKEEALGKEINRLIVPEDHEEEAMQISLLAQSGQYTDYISKRKTRDNQLLDVSILGRPVIYNGEKLGIFGIYQDIRERKLTEEQLRRNEKRLRLNLRIAQSPSASISELLGYAIGGTNEILDCSYGLIYEYRWESNMALLLAASDNIRDEFPDGLGRSTGIFSPEGAFITVVNEYKPLIFNTRSEIEQQQLLPGVPDSVTNLMLVPVAYEGHVAAVVVLANRKGNFEDYHATEISLLMDSVWKTTEKQKVHIRLQEALARAEESDRLKSTFLAVMSHELRTPLNAIIGFSSLIDETWPIDEIIEYIKTIEASGNHLLSLINDMFHLSALEAGQLRCTREVIKIRNLLSDLSEAINAMQRIENKQHIQIRYQPDPCYPDIEITSDFQKLQDILMNLIKNSIKFTDTGSVEYGYTIQDDKLIFYVKDTGIGIPPEKGEIIFEKFRQGDESSSRRHGGLGIGLTLARELTLLLGGSIRFDSVMGAGTTFYITFGVDDFVPALAFANAPATNEIGGKTILVAEDEDSNFKLLESILQPYQTNIHRAKTGSEAVDIMRNGLKPAIVLMDIKMPEMDGFEATRTIRTFDTLTPIIAQTAYAMVGDREKALASGCNDYVSKPIRRSTLIEILEKHLSSSMKS